MKRICIITGGLGNQMFEYAYVMALRERGIEVILDISYYDFFKMHNGYELGRVFGIKEDTVSSQGVHMLWLRLLNRFRPSSLYTYDDLQFNGDALINPKKYIFGYWLDEKYFTSISSQVRKIFQFEGIDGYNLQLAEQMHNIESVSLHVRRGDYSEFGINLVGEEYYQKAINRIKEMLSNPVYYIFSDDVEVAENIAKKLNIEYVMVTHNQNQDSYKDMYLMSQCKHNIIANSSFSWWGAWLGNNVNKITIAPKTWLESSPDFKPQLDNWILL